MWGLDRLSAQSTPAPSPPPPRNYSPGPRRPTLLGATSRSSQNLVSASNSNLNLPGTSRPTSSSGLRNQIYNAPPAETEDPVKALERILSAPTLEHKKSVDEKERKQQPQPRPSKLVNDIDFKNLNLYEFASLQKKPTVTKHIKQSIEEYEQEKEKFDDLHKSINACDDVLVSVETYLSGFQSDLGAVSTEIETLQLRSTEINGQLENRRDVEKILGPVVDQLTIPPPVVQRISEEPIDKSWVRALEELESRAKVLGSSSSGMNDTKAAEDLKPMIENLSNRAIERIRDYLAAQIKALRSPNINAQIIQQQNFLLVSKPFAFLASRQPQLAEDILRAYVNTIRWYYLSHFTRYQISLTKLKIFSTDRSNLLGEDTATARKQAPTSQNPFAATIPTSDPFNISRRIDIFKHPTTTALPSHAAEDSKTPHHIETPFLSFHLALLDNACFEYTFLSSFLPPALRTHQRLTSCFNDIFAPSLQLGTNLTKSLVAESYDALGVLLMVRLNQHFAFNLQRRKVPALDSYVNGTNMTLWPRFQSIMDAHCESMKKLASALPTTRSAASSSASAVSSLTSSSNSTSASGSSSASSTAPRPISQRTAHFLNSILLLTSEAGDDEPVSNSLNRLRSEFENVLTKMGQSFGAGERGRRERERFLKNNISLVLAVVDAGDKNESSGGRLRAEVREALESIVQD